MTNNDLYKFTNILLELMVLILKDNLNYFIKSNSILTRKTYQINYQQFQLSFD